MGAVLLRHDRTRQCLHARPERACFLDLLVLTMDDGRRSARQNCWLHGLGDLCTFVCATSLPAEPAERPAIKTAIAIKTATAATAASALALTAVAALATTALASIAALPAFALPSPVGAQRTA